MPVTSSSPQGNRLLPSYNESSPQRPLTDPDATGRQWQRARKAGAQETSNLLAITTLRRDMGKLRRIIHGGGGSTAGSALVPEQWNPAKQYQPGQIVFFTPSGASAATFYAIQVSTNVQPDTGSPNWGKFPSGAPGMWL